MSTPENENLWGDTIEEAMRIGEERAPYVRLHNTLRDALFQETVVKDESLVILKHKDIALLMSMLSQMVYS